MTRWENADYSLFPDSWIGVMNAFVHSWKPPWVVDRLISLVKGQISDSLWAFSVFVFGPIALTESDNFVNFGLLRENVGKSVLTKNYVCGCEFYCNYKMIIKRIYYYAEVLSAVSF